MNIAMVTPSYPSTDCGIATYTGYLAHELASISSLRIVGTQAIKNDDDGDFVDAIIKGIGDAEVVHLQHTYDLYGYLGYNTFKLLRRLKSSGKVIVTTIHELPDPKTKGIKARVALPYLKRVIRSILQYSAAVIVHSHADRNLISSWGLDSSNIHVIPHGTMDLVHVTTSRDPGLLKGKIGFFGFVMPHKGIHRVIEVMQEFPDTQLVIAGKPKSDADQLYYQSLQASVQQRALSSQVKFAGFVPDEQMADFFNDMDAVVFPYSSCTASGALHLALAHESVALASDIDIFREMHELYDCVELFDLNDPGSLSKQLHRILSDIRRRQELINGSRRLSQATGWTPVARQHLELYHSVVG